MRGNHPPAPTLVPRYAHAAVVAGGVAFLVLFPFLWLQAFTLAVLALAAVVVMVAGHVCLTGELFVARVALEEHRRQNLQRIMAHRREDLATMQLARPGKHLG